MGMHTLALEEETITEMSDMTMQITNCVSFQNLSGTFVRWSSIPFSTSNMGAITEERSIEIFAAARDIYIKKCSMSPLIIHVRSIPL